MSVGTNIKQRRIELRHLGEDALQRLRGIFDGMHAGKTALAGAAARAAAVSHDDRIVVHIRISLLLFTDFSIPYKIRNENRFF